ncbi:MAG TPA: hypothetical protein VH415_00370 [Nitrososphaeraceae archaeon]|jgi:hypothetical protein
MSVETFNGLDDCSTDRLVNGFPKVTIVSGLGILDSCITLCNSITRRQLGQTNVSYWMDEPELE